MIAHRLRLSAIFVVVATGLANVPTASATTVAVETAAAAVTAAGPPLAAVHTVPLTTGPRLAADTTAPPADTLTLAGLKAEIEELKLDVWQAQWQAVGRTLMIVGASITYAAVFVYSFTDPDLATTPQQRERLQDLRSLGVLAGVLGAGLAAAGLLLFPGRRARARRNELLARNAARQEAARRRREARRAARG